jgi:hypothetical protein
VLRFHLFSLASLYDTTLFFHCYVTTLFPSFFKDKVLFIDKKKHYFAGEDKWKKERKR